MIKVTRVAVILLYIKLEASECLNGENHTLRLTSNNVEMEDQGENGVSIPQGVKQDDPQFFNGQGL